MDLQRQKTRVGIDELVAHSDRPDDVASKDPEMRMWDALDAGTHDDTLKGAILEHMQACPDLRCFHHSSLIPESLTYFVMTIMPSDPPSLTPASAFLQQQRSQLIDV